MNDMFSTAHFRLVLIFKKFSRKKMSNGFVKKTFKSFNSKQKLSYIVD